MYKTALQLGQELKLQDVADCNWINRIIIRDPFSLLSSLLVRLVLVKLLFVFLDKAGCGVGTDR